MQNPTDLTKVDLSKLLPPIGVPFKTEEQRDIAIPLHNAGVLRLQLHDHINWVDGNKYSAKFEPSAYRLAPPPPMRFERVTVESLGLGWTGDDDPSGWIADQLLEIGNGKKARVTIVVEEVRE